jgi:mRNA interferase RelE/StbE
LIYEIRFTPTSEVMLGKVGDRRIREKIKQRIEGLREDPEKQGKPLGGELEGLRSVRAVGQRYRVLYQVRRELVIVVIVAVGIRQEGGKRDVYEIARKLVRLGLLGIERR